MTSSIRYSFIFSMFLLLITSSSSFVFAQKKPSTITKLSASEFSAAFSGKSKSSPNNTITYINKKEMKNTKGKAGWTSITLPSLQSIGAAVTTQSDSSISFGGSSSMLSHELSHGSQSGGGGGDFERERSGGGGCGISCHKLY